MWYNLLFVIGIKVWCFRCSKFDFLELNFNLCCEKPKLRTLCEINNGRG